MLRERCRLDEAAEILGIDRTDVRDMAKFRLVPKAAQFGRSWTFDIAELNRLAVLGHLGMLIDHANRQNDTFNVDCKVYFVEITDFIKIGYSAGLQGRLAAYRTSSPYRVKLLASMPGTRDVEEYLSAASTSQ
jgi:hypothetical protein